MIRALIFALCPVFGLSVAVEWKGVFLTPDDEYTWIAQKVDGDYADPQMVLVVLPVTNTTASTESEWTQVLTDVNTNGTTAMTLTCESVTTGDTMTPAEDKCYTLVFDASSSETTYKVNTAGVPAVAFFAQHVPTEFENDKHYFKDVSQVDIEPAAQDPEGAHAHHHHSWADEFEGKCVCQAANNNWQIDCTNQALITAAVNRLEADAACKAASPPAACVPDYYIMQAHHDHCLHNQLPTGIEHTLHDYEHYYDDCLIQRQYNSAYGQCPTVDCTDQLSLTNAANTLAACAATAEACATTACSAAMKIVVVAHDTCPESVLPDNLEKALHDHEEPCEDQLCNVASGAFDPYDDPCSASVSAADGLGPNGFLMTMSALSLGCVAI